MTTAEKPKVYGWYSEQQEVEAGYYIYKTLDGGDVRITETTHSPTYTSKFDDAVGMGEVGKFVLKFEEYRGVCSSRDKRLKRIRERNNTLAPGAGRG